MRTMRPLAMACLAGLALFALAAPAQVRPRPGDRARPRDGNLRVGQSAPDFAVKDPDGKKTVKLSDLKGKPVVLIFGSCT